MYINLRVAIFVLHLQFQLKIMNKLIITILASLLLTFTLKGQSNTVETLINEGIILHDSTEYALAIEKFKAALKLNPKSNLALYELSLSYLELKDFENALLYSTQVINTNDQLLLVGAYAVKNEALVGLGKIDDAISILNEGIVKLGESYLFHFNLALNYYKKGDIDRTIKHVDRAIELDKTFSGAFLLSAYAQRDKGLWIRSIYSFQMFLLLEPDSQRSRNAFEEMLQAMYITPQPEDEGKVQRSFINLQMNRNKSDEISSSVQENISPDDEIMNRETIYNNIQTTIDSIRGDSTGLDLFVAFKEVNKTILQSLSHKGLEETSLDNFWSFKYPFFKSILNSNYYETYCRYISVSFLPESLKWWQENEEEAGKFINWFEKGEDNSVN